MGTVINSNTERRGRVVNTPSYSKGTGFDSRPRRPPILIEVLHGFFLGPSKRMPR
jgi:hypothetical protein